MRFRLKYLLGDYQADQVEDDPYADAAQDDFLGDDDKDDQQRELDAQKIQAFVERIWNMTREQRAADERQHGNLDDMEADQRSAALDRIEAECSSTDEYASIVSDILEELRERFNNINIGTFEKNTTSWPRLWSLETTDKKQFFNAMQHFAGIHVTRWGRLLTPLVNGIRVAGPFQPVWAASIPRLVVFDTEGLGHKADASADLPDHV